MNRLITASSSNVASGSNYSHKFSYDALGNILSGPAGTYAYSAASSSYANPHALTSLTLGTSTTNYAYDQNGNLTSSASSTYAWDYKNRLVSAGNHEATSTFSYSYDDQRVQKTSGDADTIYVNKFYEVHGSTTTAYIWAGDRLVATIERNDSTTSTTYTHPDHLNSVSVTTDSAGEISSARDYYPYGEERISSGELSRTFLSQVKDTETDLQYLNARYYDSARGQFVSQDPVFWELQQNLAEPQSLNSYSYAQGNPIVHSDPTGRQIGLALPFMPVAPAIGWGAIGTAAFPYIGVGAVAIGGAMAIPWVLSGPFQNQTTAPFGQPQYEARTEQVTYEPLANMPPPGGGGDWNKNPDKWKWAKLIGGTAGFICEFTNCVEKFYSQFTPPSPSGESSNGSDGNLYWNQPPSSVKNQTGQSGNSGGGSGYAPVLPRQNPADRYSFSGGVNKYGESYNSLFSQSPVAK